MFQLVGGVHSISSDRRAHALPMQCALRLAFGQDIRSNVWSLVKMAENGALRFAARPDFGPRLYRALTGGSKCDYIQLLARLPRQPGFRVARLGMKPPVHTGGFARFRAAL